MTKVEPGTVVSYEHGRGIIELPNGDTLPFGSAHFRSGRPTREPQLGDKVEVVRSGASGSSSVLYVRIRRDSASVAGRASTQ